MSYNNNNNIRPWRNPDDNSQSRSNSSNEKGSDFYNKNRNNNRYNWLNKKNYSNQNQHQQSQNNFRSWNYNNSNFEDTNRNDYNSNALYHRRRRPPYNLNNNANNERGDMNRNKNFRNKLSYPNNREQNKTAEKVNLMPKDDCPVNPSVVSKITNTDVNPESEIVVQSNLAEKVHVPDVSLDNSIEQTIEPKSQSSAPMLSSSESILNTPAAIHSDPALDSNKCDDIEHFVQVPETSGKKCEKDVIHAELFAKKLLNDIKNMDKDNLKRQIMNPHSKYESALKNHARQKLRTEMRKQLRNFNLPNCSDNNTVQEFLEPDECVDSDKIPDALFVEMERVLNIKFSEDNNEFQLPQIETFDKEITENDNILMNYNSIENEELTLAMVNFPSENFMDLNDIPCTSPADCHVSIDEKSSEDAFIDGSPKNKIGKIKVVPFEKLVQPVEKNLFNTTDESQNEENNLTDATDASISTEESKTKKKLGRPSKKATKTSPKPKNKNLKEMIVKKESDEKIESANNVTILKATTMPTSENFTKTNFTKKIRTNTQNFENSFSEVSNLIDNCKLPLNIDNMNDTTDALDNFPIEQIDDNFVETQCQSLVNQILNLSQSGMDDTCSGFDIMHTIGLSNHETRGNLELPETTENIELPETTFETESKSLHTNDVIANVATETIIDLNTEEIFDVTVKYEKMEGMISQSSSDKEKLVLEETPVLSPEIEPAKDEHEENIATLKNDTPVEIKVTEVDSHHSSLKNSNPSKPHIKNGKNTPCDKFNSSNRFSISTSIFSTKKSSNNKKDDKTLDKSAKKSDSGKSVKNKADNIVQNSKPIVIATKNAKSSSSTTSASVSNKKILPQISTNKKKEKPSSPAPTSKDTPNTIINKTYFRADSLIVNKNTLLKLKSLDDRMNEFQKTCASIDDTIAKLQKERVETTNKILQLYHDKTKLMETLFEKTTISFNSAKFKSDDSQKSLHNPSAANEERKSGSSKIPAKRKIDTHITGPEIKKPKSNESSLEPRTDNIEMRKSVERRPKDTLSKEFQKKIITDKHFPSEKKSNARENSKDMKKFQNKNGSKNIVYEKTKSKNLFVADTYGRKDIKVDHSNMNLSRSSKSKSPMIIIDDSSLSNDSTNLINCDISSTLKPCIVKVEKLSLQTIKEYTIGTTSSVWDGQFIGHKSPIVFMKTYGAYLLAASEDSNIYRYSLKNGTLDKIFELHKGLVTAFIMDDNENVFSISVDGFMHKFNVDNFTEIIESIDVREPLQSIEYKWETVFVGCRSGNIHMFDESSFELPTTPLCELKSNVLAIKASMEGPRKIIIVAAKNLAIAIRDVPSGLLLRTIEIPVNTTIYSLILNRGRIIYGSSKSDLISVDFSTGTEKRKIKCGSGAVSIQVWKCFLFVGCYDGFIYVYNRKTFKLFDKIQGPGKMLLNIEVVGNKCIAACKDNTFKIWNMPKDIILASQ